MKAKLINKHLDIRNRYLRRKLLPLGIIMMGLKDKAKADLEGDRGEGEEEGE